MSDETEDPQHGPAETYYNNLPGPDQTPMLVCICGWRSSDANGDWRDVGSEFDEHLEDTRPTEDGP